MILEAVMNSHIHVITFIIGMILCVCGFYRCANSGESLTDLVLFVIRRSLHIDEIHKLTPDTQLIASAHRLNSWFWYNCKINSLYFQLCHKNPIFVDIIVPVRCRGGKKIVPRFMLMEFIEV